MLIITTARLATAAVKNTTAIAALAAALLVSACASMPMGATPPSAVTRTQGQPWQDAQRVLAATTADIEKIGLRGVAPHVKALEDALTQANNPFGDMPPETGDRIVLVDGQSENLGALLIGATQRDGRKTVTVANPYPAASFFLGSYYNEVQRPADALRVLDAGLALPGPFGGTTNGQLRPSLISERGVALNALKRWPDALANYESGLMLSNLEDRMKARLLRGRGFVLIELGRLDDAEMTFHDSLVAEPNNPIALNELGYIARLRAGGAPAAPRIVLPNARPPST